MSLAELSLDAATDLIAKGIEEELRRSLKQKLITHANEIIESVCADAAKRITSQVSSYSNVRNMEVVLQIRFNDREVE
jgi:hypothetical protein